MQILGPAPAVLTPEQIIGQKEALDQTIKAAVDPQYEFDRQIQINKARLQWHMVKGNHFAVPGMVDTDYGRIADYVSLSGQTSDGTEKFNYAINLIGGDLYKFVAVMGNTAPRVKAIADDPKDPQSLDAASNADACLRDLWRKWKADQLQRVLAFHQYTTGPVYGRTVWVTDGRKYGKTVEPKLDLQPGPDGTPLPVQSGVQSYDNGDVELHLYTVLEVEHPYMVKSLDECPYLKLEVMRSKWDLLAAYASEDPNKPGPLEQYRDSDPPDDDTNASSNTAAEARESVATPSGTGRTKRKDQWRFREWWLNPFLYEAVGDKTLRAALKRQYADGLYIAKVGSVTVKIDNRKLTDEWRVCKTGRGERIVEDAISSDAVPYQRALDDLVNMAQETVLRAISQTFVNSQLVDREALKSKEAIPGEYILTLPPEGDMSKQFFQPTPARVSDQLAPLTMQLRTMWQDNTGIRPELSGAGQPTSTYREAKQRKDQALMQLSPQAQEMQYFWQGVGENGVRMRAKFGSGTIKASRKGAYGTETDTVDMAQLQDGNWHCEADDNFPMSSSDRFDKMWALLKEFPPEVQQALSIMDPINLEETIELLQIPGYESTVEDHKRKTLADVAQLLAAAPVDGPPGPDGQPGPKQASLQIDPEDNHQFVAQFLQVWMISKTGQKEKNTRPQGFDNVRAFWQAQKQAAAPPQPPPPPPVRATLSVSAKAEDMPPAFTNEILQGAGLAPGLPTEPPASPQAAANGLSAPSPVAEQPSPHGDAQQGGLPPLPSGPPPGPQLVQ